MQNQITTDPKIAVIIFKDRSKKFITQKELNYIKTIDTDSFTLDGKNEHSFTSINKILYLDEYYNLYPQERPPQYNFFDEDNKNRESGYLKNYSSKTFCERAIADFTRIIAERKEKGLPYHNIKDLLEYAKNKLNKLTTTSHHTCEDNSGKKLL